MDPLWEWVFADHDAAVAAGDTERLAMIEDFRGGSSRFLEAPEVALHRLTQAYDRAVALDDRRWALLCDHWICQTLHFGAQRHDLSLERARRAVRDAEADPTLSSLPQRACLEDDLILPLAYQDPIGHRAEIERRCAEMARFVHPGTGCETCLLRQRVDVHIDNHEREEAHALIRAAIARGDERRATVSAKEHAREQAGWYNALCILARQAGNLRLLAHFASAAEQYYEPAADTDGAAQLLMWHALGSVVTGHRERAARCFHEASRALDRPDFRHGWNFYDAMALCHRSTGDLAGELRVRAVQLTHCATSPHLRAMTHLERLRALNAMGLPRADEQAALSAALGELIDPAAFLRLEGDGARQAAADG